jgi:TetR/AcrR family transcriptional regulator
MARRATQARDATVGRAAAKVRTHVPRDARRVQILDAAAELFAQRGFAGTTTKRIASAVGTSETILFRHFPTKESLYTAILQHSVPIADLESWLEELQRIADTRDDKALFTAVVKAILQSYRTNTVYHRLMLFAALENHELARLGQITYSAPVARFLRKYVSRRQSEGALKHVRPAMIVHTLVSVPGHFALWNSLGVNPLGLTEHEVAAHAVSLVISELRSDR